MSKESQIYISQYEIAADTKEIAPVRMRFIEFLLSLGLDDGSKEAWKLTFTEAVNNAIEHGSNKNPNLRVSIRWWVDGSSVWLETQDSGSGPSAELIENPQLPEDPLAEGGRGLFIIYDFADTIEHWVGTDGYIGRIGKNYSRLNSVLPQNAEMDAILDELSDCYESLSLFDRMAENLIGNESIEAFTQSGLDLFMDARDYDAIHLEMRDQDKEPEYRRMASIDEHSAFGSASEQQWSLLEENESFSWNHQDSANNFPENRKYGQGCAVPLIVNNQIIGLIAVANEEDERSILSKDIRNLRALADVIAVSLSRDLMERVRDERKRLTMEVGIATKLQQKLLPLKALPPKIPGYDLFYKSLSALEVAGDFVEVRQTSSGDYLGCIIDVMGKGISAAILAGIFRSQLIAYTSRGGGLATFMECTNQALEEQLGSATMFITAFVFHLNVESGELSYAAAGHPPALLFKDGRELDLLESTAPPLGLFPETQYSLNKVRLEEGDRLIVVTDGLYEWSNGDDIFGWESMVEWFKTHHTLSAEECWEGLQSKIISTRSQNKIAQEDDETILILTKGL